MDKLLHERLREADMTDCDGAVNAVSGKRCDEFDLCKDCYETLCSDMADEIERYYIPRPRFEDGEPVQWGDEIEHPATEESCSVKSIHMFEDGYFCITCHDCSGSAVYSAGEGVKRPDPKVLDADGVEVKTGDTVWHSASGRRGTVELLKGSVVIVNWDDGGFSAGGPAYSLTHREPDSLEKLLGDIKDYGSEIHVGECWPAATDEWARRLAALIERNAR